MHGVFFHKSPKTLVVILLAMFSHAPVGSGVEVRRAVPATTSGVNETARLLAGMEPGGHGSAAAVAQTPEWQSYARDMDAAWARLAAGRLDKIRAWSARELGFARYQSVFYPFSGPDFTYVFSYFPEAPEYLLCGLEPVGTLPDPARIANPGVAFTVLRHSLSTLLTAGYFVTKSMRVELSVGEIKGTLPLLCLQLARAGCEIDDVEAGASHVVIRFSAPHGPRQRVLRYDAQDLSNGPLGSAYVGRIRKRAPVTTYVKSCSYLLHREAFSEVRRLILTASSAILQDDSGIPLRHFDRNRWRLRFYGVYTPPLDIFKEYYQPDLAAAYQSLRATSPLEFGAGYKWNPKEACLLFATAK